MDRAVTHLATNDTKEIKGLKIFNVKIASYIQASNKKPINIQETETSIKIFWDMSREGEHQISWKTFDLKASDSSDQEL